MKKIKIILLCFLMLNIGTRICPAQKASDLVRFEILMNNQLLRDAKIAGNFTGSFAVTAGRQLILSSDSQFYLLGLGNIVHFGKPSLGISAFALTPDSMLMAIKNDELCMMDSTGNLTSLLKLPAPGMGISPGKYVMYLYGRNSSSNSNAIYMLEPGGRYVKLIEMPGPINDAVEKDNSIVFCSGNAVFEFSLPVKNLKTLAVLQANKTVRSVATDPSSGSVFFSASREVYAVKGDTLVMIAGDLGGRLGYHEGLIIFDHEAGSIIRLTANDNALVEVLTVPEVEPVAATSIPAAAAQSGQQTPATGPAKRVLKNDDVVGFVNSGFSEALIVTIINNSEVDFDLGVDAMISLAESKVSSGIILAMRQATKNPE